MAVYVDGHGSNGGGKGGSSGLDIFWVGAVMYVDGHGSNGGGKGGSSGFEHSILEVRGDDSQNSGG